MPRATASSNSGSGRGVVGNDGAAVLDQIREAEVILIADRLLERHRVLVDALDLTHPLDGELDPWRHLFDGRLPAELLEQLALRPHHLVDRLDHVDRDADGAGLVGDGPGDRLADPPRRIGRELEPLGVIELVDGAHEAEVALLDEIEKGQTAIAVSLGDGNHEPKVGLDESSLLCWPLRTNRRLRVI